MKPTTTFKWYDLQDESNFNTGTLQQAKEWLIDFWAWNPYSEEDLEEMEEEYNEAAHFDEIRCADAKELDNMMQGIGWTLEGVE